MGTQLAPVIYSRVKAKRIASLILLALKNDNACWTDVRAVEIRQNSIGFVLE